MTPSPSDQCIVLPFRAKHRQPLDGVGLALHFLIGNVLVLHTGFKEMWFGWRVKKLFADKAALQDYCRNPAVQMDLVHASQAQRIRFWLYGTFTDSSVSLYFFDGQAPDKMGLPVELPITTEDGLVGFRTRFIGWLASVGRPLPERQREPSLWFETADRKGLDAVGRALEGFYIYSAFGGDGPLPRRPFEKAVAAAPHSFMAQDLYGWSLYRNQEYIQAKIAFLKSLRINPAGAGAMSGLMWCGVYRKDLEEALYWSGRKADVCGQDVQAARESARRRYEKANR